MIRKQERETCYWLCEVNVNVSISHDHSDNANADVKQVDLCFQC